MTDGVLIVINTYTFGQVSNWAQTSAMNAQICVKDDEQRMVCQIQVAQRAKTQTRMRSVTD